MALNRETAKAQVYIIESPSAKDLREGRAEGRALSEALDLAEIEKRYWLVVDRTQLQIVINEIVDDLGPLDAAFPILPIFHISAHGNTSGIGLTNGDSISWPELSSLLFSVGERTKRINASGVAFAHITLSSCQGMYGAEMLRVDPLKCPAAAVIGPRHNILWTDALTGWLVFYHLLLIKRAVVDDKLVATVNDAVGLEKGFRMTFATPEWRTSSPIPFKA